MSIFLHSISQILVTFLLSVTRCIVRRVLNKVENSEMYINVINCQNTFALFLQDYVSCLSFADSSMVNMYDVMIFVPFVT